jgi:hypothetical protein
MKQEGEWGSGVDFWRELKSDLTVIEKGGVGSLFWKKVRGKAARK